MITIHFVGTFMKSGILARWTCMENLDPRGKRVLVVQRCHGAKRGALRFEKSRGAGSCDVSDGNICTGGGVIVFARERQGEERNNLSRR